MDLQWRKTSRVVRLSRLAKLVKAYCSAAIVPQTGIAVFVKMATQTQPISRFVGLTRLVDLNLILVPGGPSHDRQCASCGTGTTTYKANQYTCVLKKQNATSTSNLRSTTTAPTAELSTGVMSANFDGSLVALVCSLHLIAKLF